MEGYDIPQYVNIQYPWDGREDVWRDAVPSEFNPVASYVKYFTLPEGFRKSGLYISFQHVVENKEPVIIILGRRTLSDNRSPPF